MRVSILIVISAIVIMVMALVLLTIFSTGIGPIHSITGAQSQCAQIGRSTCSSVGTLPNTWAIPTMRVNEAGQTVTRSCAHLMRAICGEDLPRQTCLTCNFPTP